MNEQHLKDFQQDIEIIGINKIIHNAGNAEWFAREYEAVYPDKGKLCTTCPGVLQNAITEIISLTNLKIEIMANKKSQYSLKNPKSFIDTVYNPISGVPAHVNNDNLTDEIAELLLKSNPNFKNQLVKGAEINTPEDAPGPGNTEETQPGEDTTAEKPKSKKAQVEELMEENSKQELIKLAKSKGVEHETDATKEAIAKAIVNAEK